MSIDGDDDQLDPSEPIAMEITDELDLHTFRPNEVAELVPDYLDECVARGFEQVRIIHGKGKGTLRRIVHAALERHPAVVSFELGGLGGGSWGATIAVLRRDGMKGGS
jgi:dsDNA-specific endonuclease/ATPase MutS2